MEKKTENVEKAINEYLETKDASLLEKIRGTAGTEPFGDPDLGYIVAKGNLSDIIERINKITNFSDLLDNSGVDTLRVDPSLNVEVSSAELDEDGLVADINDIQFSDAEEGVGVLDKLLKILEVAKELDSSSSESESDFEEDSLEDGEDEEDYDSDDSEEDDDSDFDEDEYDDVDEDDDLEFDDTVESDDDSEYDEDSEFDDDEDDDDSDDFDDEDEEDYDDEDDDFSDEDEDDDEKDTEEFSYSIRRLTKTVNNLLDSGTDKFFFDASEDLDDKSQAEIDLEITDKKLDNTRSSDKGQYIQKKLDLAKKYDGVLGIGGSQEAKKDVSLLKEEKKALNSKSDEKYLTEKKKIIEDQVKKEQDQKGNNGTEELEEVLKARVVNGSFNKKRRKRFYNTISSKKSN